MKFLKLLKRVIKDPEILIKWFLLNIKYINKNFCPTKVNSKEAKLIFDVWSYQNIRNIKAALPLILESKKIFDIGSNCGYLSKEIIDQGYSGEIILFEPIPNLIELSKKLLRKTKNKKYFLNYALGDSTDNLTLFLPDDNNIGWITAIKQKTNSTSTLKVVQKDTSIYIEKFKPDFCKIDVEGYEYPILKKFIDEISDNYKPSFLIELGWGVSNPYWEKFILLAKQFIQKGYSFYVIEDGIKKLTIDNLINLNSTIDVILTFQGKALEYYNFKTNFKLNKHNKPSAIKDISNFKELLSKKIPFCFVRFSDGEMEIIKNRFLKINSGETYFRGEKFKNNYPKYDSKEFNPSIHSKIRDDLLETAIKSKANYFKGIPTSHNTKTKDRDLMLLLNGGLDEHITFSDLLMNSNYKYFRSEILPLFKNYDSKYLIANYRSKPERELKNFIHIKIGDNFFANYETTKLNLINELKDIPNQSLIISSASSLTNIIGFYIYNLRPDITFIDIGSSLNDLIGLRYNVRAYQNSYFNNGIKAKLSKLKPSYRISW